MSVTNIRHTGIVISNLSKALHFYRDLLGFKEVKRETLKGKYIYNLLKLKILTYVKLAIGDNLIELYVLPNNPSTGFHHIALTVDNLDKLYKKLRKEKIYGMDKPILDPDKTHKVWFCEDYDGNLIELVEELK